MADGTAYMSSDRLLRYEVVTRLREAEELGQHERARAFDEVYTIIKGCNLGTEKRSYNRIIRAKYSPSWEASQ